MADSNVSLETALRRVAHPDIQVVVDSWNQASNELIGPLSPQEWRESRQLAQQSTLLRMAYCMFKEGILAAGSYRFIVTPKDVTPKDHTKPIIELSSAEEVANFIYTRNILDAFDLTLEAPAAKSWFIRDVHVLWNDVLRPVSDERQCRSHFNWSLALYELLDSLNNETLSMGRRLKFFNRIRDSGRTFTNAWHWLTKQNGLARFLEDANRTARDSTDRCDEVSFLQNLAALSGHRTHPMAHTRTRLEGELDEHGSIIQPSNDASPVSSLSVEEVMKNCGAFGLPNYLPVLALHVKEAKIRAVAREGVDNPVNGVGELSPARYRARFQRQHPRVYASWATWIQERGHILDDYVPMPVHSLNIAYIKTFKTFTESKVDGKPALLFPPNERRDIAIASRTTSTTRTMSPILSNDCDHLKLPIPVQVTSYRRHLAPARVFSAPVISKLLESIVGVEYGDGGSLPGEDPELKRYMKIIPEPLGIYWDDRGEANRYSDAYFLGCIVRENPARFVSKDQILLELNVLFERSPFTGKPLAIDILAAQAKDTPEGSLEWFKDYADTVVKGQVGLLARYGLGIEAHQQNTLVLFDKTSGRLVQTVNRDFADGLFISRPLLALRNKDISNDIHKVKKYLSDDVEMPTKQIYHGMVSSHLFPLLCVLNQECGMDAAQAKAAVRESMRQTFNAAREDFAKTHAPSSSEKTQFDQLTGKIEKWLEQNLVREKALLSMRLDQTFESKPLYRENLLHPRAADALRFDLAQNVCPDSCRQDQASANAIRSIRRNGSAAPHSS